MNCLKVIILLLPLILGTDARKKIKKVHVVFMNHLDIGYSDGTTHGVGYAIDVINNYFTDYFPRAIDLGKKLKKDGYIENFVYTTHPWLISLYIDCPAISIIGKKLKCPNFKDLNNFFDAVRDGTIAWHAGPMNMQTDNMGADLFDFGLDIAINLDKKFGINRTHATYSQRDVPGMTKTVIPILMSHNIKAISVGVNPGAAPPAIPSPFLWKLREDDTDGIIAFWDQGGYPMNPGPVPSQPGGLAKDKCIMAEGLDEALCFAFRTDNSGPPSNVKEILSNYEILRAEFQEAKIFSSTFDNFVASLEKVKDKLPVHHFEIGDTWIQGIASDPLKISMYRAFIRCIEICFLQGNCSYTDRRIFEALRYLIKVPEHTWGAHNFLNSIDWTNSDLESARHHSSFKETELTWHEQRQFIYLAQKALMTHPVSANVSKAISELEPVLPNLNDYYPATMIQPYKCADGTIVEFGVDGSLIRLYDAVNQIEWASSDNPLGQLTYETFVEKDFTDMAKQYNYDAGVGFDKPNVTDNAHPVKKRWETGVISFLRKSDDSCDFLLEMKMFSIETVAKYGAPKTFYLNYVSVPNQGVDVSVLTMNKTTTRLPESLSFSFTPRKSEKNNWSMSKMGVFINPCHVVLNGSQYVHAVDSSIRLANQNGSGLYIEAKDSPVIMWGTTDHVPSPFPVPLQPFNCSSITSVAFNLFNNIWNTNYIYWYPYSDSDASFKSRFRIYFK